jgi:hypothetical protein
MVPEGFLKAKPEGEAARHSNGLVVLQGPAPAFWVDFNTDNVNANDPLSPAQGGSAALSPATQGAGSSKGGKDKGGKGKGKSTKGNWNQGLTAVPKEWYVVTQQGKSKDKGGKGKGKSTKGKSAKVGKGKGKSTKGKSTKWLEGMPDVGSSWYQEGNSSGEEVD